MIIEQHSGRVTKYIVDKDFADDKIENFLNHKLTPDQISTIITDDADVYTKTGNLLLSFRKNKLNKENMKGVL